MESYKEGFFFQDEDDDGGGDEDARELQRAIKETRAEFEKERPCKEQQHGGAGSSGAGTSRGG